MMDDYKNKNSNSRYGEQDDQRNGSNERKNDSSYYYSYGPFSSMNSNDQRSGSSEADAPRREEVQMTPPDPIKPIPLGYRDSSHSSSQGRPEGNGRGEGNWNFKQSKQPKSGSSFKSMFLSFMAGALVITALMYTSDVTNLFTGKSALAPAVQQEQSSGSSNNGNSSNAVTASLPAGAADVQSVVKTASPAVVKIETLVKQSSGRSRQSSPYFNDPLYQYFFGDQGGSNSQNNSNSGNGQLTPLGIGSGFIFDKTGYILTNNHVIDGADVVQVTLENNNKPFEAKVLGSSADLDLAVLKIEGDNFPTVQLGDSDQAQVGEWMVAIGNPEGFEHSVTAGVLSATGRTITINDQSTGRPTQYKNLIQTDASINPGNSGGPLLNLQGQVIGMNVAVSADAQGIGFAIPSNTIKSVVEKLKNNQEIPKEPVPFIGATLMNLTPEVAKEMDTSLTEGSVVGEVIYRSPAYQADLRSYDIIIGANGTKYATTQELIDFIQKQSVGSTITLNIERFGKKIDLPVKIGNKNDFNTNQTTTPGSTQQP